MLLQYAGLEHLAAHPSAFVNQARLPASVHSPTFSVPLYPQKVAKPYGKAFPHETDSRRHRGICQHHLCPKFYSRGYSHEQKPCWASMGKERSCEMVTNTQLIRLGRQNLAHAHRGAVAN